MLYKWIFEKVEVELEVKVKAEVPSLAQDDSLLKSTSLLFLI
jgi:hypothetical protein